MHSPKLSEIAISKLDQLLHSAVEQEYLPRVVAVVANRQTILYRGAANAALSDIHRIASMTKPVTSVGMMILVERGLLSLDDAVARYLPAFADRPVIDTFNPADGTFTSKPAAQPMTIRHLLAHTSGLGYDFCNATLYELCKDRKYSPRSAPLLHEPGAAWTYGHSTAIVGEIIEKVTGESIDSFLEREIFQPLSMSETSYQLQTADQPRFAPLYKRESNEWVRDTEADQFRPYVVGDTGLISTAESYMPFLQMLLNEGQWQDHRLLAPASVQEMIRNQIGDLKVETQPSMYPRFASPFPVGAGNDKFGLGFQIKVAGTENARSPGSYSWAGIHNTHFWVDPQKGIAGLFFTQMLPFCDKIFLRVFADFERCLYENLS